MLAARVGGKAARAANALFASKAPQPTSAALPLKREDRKERLSSDRGMYSTDTSDTLEGRKVDAVAECSIHHEEGSEWVLRKSYLVLVKGSFPGTASGLAAHIDSKPQSKLKKLTPWGKLSHHLPNNPNADLNATTAPPTYEPAFRGSNSDALAATASWAPLNQPWTSVEWVSSTRLGGFVSVRSTVGLVDVESNRYGPIAPGDAPTDGKLSHSLFSLICTSDSNRSNAPYFIFMVLCACDIDYR